jgi:hypothetical protein
MKSFGTVKGTTGTTFDVVGSFKAGKVAYRDLGSNSFRIRVPLNGSQSLDLAGWQAPGQGQNRYSKVVNGVKELAAGITEAAAALTAASATVSVSFSE